VDATLEAFRLAWNADRVDDVKAMFAPESRASFSRSLDRIVERHQWHPLPQLTPTHRTDEGYFAAAYFQLPGSEKEFYTSWTYDRATKGWVMNLFRVPK